MVNDVARLGGQPPVVLPPRPLSAAENCMGKFVRWIRDDESPIALRVTVFFASMLGLIILPFVLHLPILFAAVTLPAILWFLVENHKVVVFIDEAQQEVWAQEEVLANFRRAQMFPLMKEAVGGEAAFRRLPVLNIDDERGFRDYIDYLTPQEMAAPVVRGIDSRGRPFISLKMRDRQDGTVRVVTFNQRNNEPSFWVIAGDGWNVFGDTCVSDAVRAQIHQIAVERNHPRVELAE